MSLARNRVINVIKQVVEHKGVSIPTINDATLLHNNGIGLDSLDTAELSVLLEQEFGQDPYSRGVFPQTVGDIVTYYMQGGVQ